MYLINTSNIATIALARSSEMYLCSVVGETLEEAGYTTWAVLEPTSFANEDCGGINQNVQLLDIRCDVEHPFICEHET
jgi:hypothetical protein